MSGAEELPRLKARITRRTANYRINEIGRAAISKFLDPDNTFSIINLGPNDKATLTVFVDVAGDPSLEGISQVHLELPAHMLEEIE